MRTAKRTIPRIPADRTVELYDENGNLLEMGTLQDWSKRGALITLNKARPLQKTIVVWFPYDYRGQKADIRWQEMRSIGVRFDKEMEMPGWLKQSRIGSKFGATHLSPAQARKQVEHLN